VLPGSLKWKELKRCLSIIYNMKITDKYISKTKADKLEKPDKDRITLTDDTYATCDFIQDLINKIECLRLSLR